jgi:AP-2 complex subunit alpha
LNGYQKKKYVSKLAFMYILGYDIDFGHMEAINLVSSPVFTEKSLGYLAVTLLVTDNPDFIRLVVNTIRKDLEDSNEINSCLALHAVANISSRDMADSLASDVYRLLNSR